ncbi:MAG: endo-1,4-beta-xylanase [Anaerohalosphaera sp.]|nr:endo-1,4-beta-xylanase [Anaerohalosphaera sp.]
MKFEAYKNGKLIDELGLAAAYMFGADSIPLRTAVKIKFEDGVIECKKNSLETAGIALQWTVNGFGRILLSTTRLPERDKPFNLNVELARERLMQVTLKREEWSLFQEDDEFADLAHKSQKLFIEALQNINDPQKASELADKSLQKSLIFAERLAAKHSELFLAARFRSRGLGRHSLGCGIDLDRIDDENYRKRLLEMFGFVTIPIKWRDIERKKGEYDFSVIDKCIELLVNKRLAICAGPLLCFDREYLPKWLVSEDKGFEEIREAAYNFVSKMVTRYCRYVHAWQVISGMNAINHFCFNIDEVIEITRSACMAAKAADGRSRKIVDIVMPWGEYYAREKDTIPPLIYCDMLIQNGIGFDALSVQMKFGKNAIGMHVRDMMQISSQLDKFSITGKTIHVSQVAVPSQFVSANIRSGIWHNKWDQAIQSKWIEHFYRIALGKSFVNSITYSSLADADKSDVPSCGLLTEDLQPKKAFLCIAKLQKLILRT